ncbi:MAG: hypothetical protein U1F36_15990 [Planctomycetota bacterium]
MKPLSMLLAVVAVALSGALHWFLFRPIDLQMPAPLPDAPSEGERRHDRGATLVVAAPEPSKEDSPPAVTPQSTTPLEDTTGPAVLATGGEPREDLLIDYRIEDEPALLAFAAANHFPTVLLDLDRVRVWPVTIDPHLGVRIPSTAAPEVSHYLLLPPLSPSGRPLRYSGWCAEARTLHQVPRGSHATLALAIDGDRLDDLGRSALRAECASRGLAPAQVTRACLRPIADGAGARLVVEDLAVEGMKKGSTRGASKSSD